MPRFVNFALAALTVAAPAAAQDIAPQIDRIFSWATPDAPGCVVGVSRHGTVLVNRAYGLADLERKVPLSPETVFDIGSTQKQFNAAAILLLVEDGRLSLSDDIRKYFPELPDYGHTITVRTAEGAGRAGEWSVVRRLCAHTHVRAARNERDAVCGRCHRGGKPCARL